MALGRGSFLSLGGLDLVFLVRRRAPGPRVETATALAPAAAAAGGRGYVTSSHRARAPAASRGLCPRAGVARAERAQPPPACFLPPGVSSSRRVPRRWRTIWETSGGRTSRPPPAAQVPARPAPHAAAPLPAACGPRRGVGGSARTRGAQLREGAPGAAGTRVGEPVVPGEARGTHTLVVCRCGGSRGGVGVPSQALILFYFTLSWKRRRPFFVFVFLFLFYFCAKEAVWHMVTRDSRTRFRLVEFKSQALLSLSHSPFHHL